MREILTDYSGQVWYVDSDKPISVKACPACGKPLEVQFTEVSPKVTHAVFRDAKGRRLAIFDTEAFPKVPSVCFFCGYEKK